MYGVIDINVAENSTNIRWAKVLVSKLLRDPIRSNSPPARVTLCIIHQYDTTIIIVGEASVPKNTDTRDRDTQKNWPEYPGFQNIFCWKIMLNYLGTGYGYAIYRIFWNTGRGQIDNNECCPIYSLNFIKPILI